ncbi:hypothetical protein BBJ28_00001741 [Nothophytophthora sp. Chile5]|nr:hypothetical protein BBJ28_00001741 [Nothophytophthora sp. Chile5]
MELPLDDETLQRVYAWIDEIPLSRPKKSIARDFSDGILAAEVVAFYFPKFVQMHNYSAANSVKQKQYNWSTLNRTHATPRKVFKRLHIHLSKDDVDDLVQCRPGAVEHLLVKLQLKVCDIANYREKRPSSSLPPQTARQPADYVDDAGSEISTNMAASGTSHTGSSQATRYSPASGKLTDARVDHLMKDLMLQDTCDGTGGMEPASTPTYAAVHPLDPLGKGHPMSSEGSAKSEDMRLELAEKGSVIEDLRETVQILEMKVQKLEQLVRLKDGKIQTLVAKLRSQKPQA